MNRFRFLAALLALAFSTVYSSAADSERVYELRVYTTNEGKLADLLTRFRDHTCNLFEKHGIENIGYWVPVDEENGSKNTLIYVIAHKSREAAKVSWAEFGKDPEWQEARKASEANGKLLAKAPESTYLKTTVYSPPIQVVKGEPRVFELRTYTTPPGKLTALHARFKNHTLGLFSKYGMTHVAYWTPTDADQGSENKLIYILAHKSKEAGMASFKAFREDPVWVKAKAESEKDGPLTLPPPDGVKSIYIKATDFSPIQ